MPRRQYDIYTNIPDANPSLNTIATRKRTIVLLAEYILKKKAHVYAILSSRLTEANEG